MARGSSIGPIIALVSVVLSDLFGTKVRDVPDVPVISCDRSIPNHAKIDIGSDKPAIKIYLNQLKCRS